MVRNCCELVLCCNIYIEIDCGIEIWHTKLICHPKFGCRAALATGAMLFASDVCAHVPKGLVLPACQ